MTITFETYNHLIVYALEKIISYARDNQSIFLAQSIWWISSIIGLKPGVITDIDNLQIRNDIGKTVETKLSSDYHIHPDRIERVLNHGSEYSGSENKSINATETDIHHEGIENCELLLEQSRQEWNSVGRKTREVSRVVKRKAKHQIMTFGTWTQGIDSTELQRRKIAGECLRCAWPSVSQRWKVGRYLVGNDRGTKRCGRNCVMERRRRW
jgi:hypothetical protein